MEATACCRFYYWSEIEVVQIKIVVQSAYTSAIKQPLLKWNGCYCDSSVGCAIGFYCHVTTFWNLIGTANFQAEEVTVWSHRSCQVISPMAWERGWATTRMSTLWDLHTMASIVCFDCKFLCCYFKFLSCYAKCFKFLSCYGQCFKFVIYALQCFPPLFVLHNELPVIPSLLDVTLGVASHSVNSEDKAMPLQQWVCQ